jgi:hypothetical protein
MTVAEGIGNFYTKCSMSLSSPANIKMPIFVMPAWIAGIQVR